MSKRINTDRISSKQPFNTLFPIQKQTQDAIVESMRQHGFERSNPLHIWKDKEGQLIVIDGHKRLDAARKLGIARVPVFEHRFRSEKEALRYVLRNQLNRRNLTAAEMLKYTGSIDERNLRAGKGNIWSKTITAFKSKLLMTHFRFFRWRNRIKTMFGLAYR